ncbi:hypothetical protein [Egicoccus sp. AB-alg2]|uniref:hypothetical protein n=1 Tax=Egicoccus sp. AB-alg2 TaxID=3242693 RepID=UPI00359D44A1
MRSLWESHRTTVAFGIAVTTLVLGVGAFALLDAAHLHPARAVVLALLFVVFASACTAIVLFEERRPRTDADRRRGRTDGAEPGRRTAPTDPRRRIDV